jgi:hypothetical protein
MMKMALLACGVSLLAVSLPGEAHAQYGGGYGYDPYPPPARNVQCERQKSSDGTGGAILGAVVGGLIGGAIGNNIDNDRYYTEYRRRGPPRTYKESRSNSGQVAVGATLGALVGGVAGSDIGKKSSGDCQVAYAPVGNYSSVPYGSIPQSTQGLYGGAEVMRGAPNSYPQPAPQPYPASSYPSSYPAPAPAPAYPPSGGYGYGQGQPAAGGDCRVIHRETKMPDGQVMRDPVTACWNDRTREWQIQDGWQDEELYGY